MNMPKFKLYKQRQIRPWGKTHHKEGKVNTKIKDILRMNTLMKDDNCAGNADEKDVSTSECISTRQVFLLIRRQNRTRFAEKMQKNMLTMSSNHNF